jgi:radical SAM superfamily enzyme YgiQ (UPF0313 family)
MSPRAREKIVLYLPVRADPARDEVVSADLLPNELLQIAGGPLAEGYDVELVDATVEDDPHRRLLEACEGALLLASSAILGWQVYDGFLAAKKVRARFPRLPIVWGGWFPSAAPELYFEQGIAEAVGIGQGELLFLDLVRALECGADLEQVSGLCLERDGALVRTSARPVVGFDKLPPTPWGLLEFERYVARQQAPTSALKVRHRMPLPRGWKPARAPRGFSHFSSFGCPTDCSFCCSPKLTGRRWKAVPGMALAEDVAALQQRFSFETLRFQDANWGVAEKRAREFAEGLLSRGTRVHWNATIEIESVMRYSDSTLDLMAASGCHLLWLGAETGTAEMQARIGKHIELDHIPAALERLYARGILAGCFWIIGFPGESEESMRETLRKAAHVKRLFPGAASEVYPFRALPGTLDWERARELGWRVPNSFEDWGRCFEWKWETQRTPLPPAVREQWRRYLQTAAFYDRHVSEGPRWLRDALRQAAGWRLARGEFRFPLEQKLFSWGLRAAGRRVSE